MPVMRPDFKLSQCIRSARPPAHPAGRCNPTFPGAAAVTATVLDFEKPSPAHGGPGSLPGVTGTLTGLGARRGPKRCQTHVTV